MTYQIPVFANGARGSAAFFFVVFKSIKLTDPDGKYIINTTTIFNTSQGIKINTAQYASAHPDIVANTSGFRTRLGYAPNHELKINELSPVQIRNFRSPIVFENNLNTTLKSIENERANPSKLVHAYSSIKASVQDIGDGVIQINISVNRYARDFNGKKISSAQNSAAIAFTTVNEINRFGGGEKGINAIANHVLADAKINLSVTP